MCELCELLASNVNIVGVRGRVSCVEWKDTVIESTCDFFKETKHLHPVLHMLLDHDDHRMWTTLNLDPIPKELWNVMGRVAAMKLRAVATIFSSETWQATSDNPGGLEIEPSQCNDRTENLIFIYETKDTPAEMTNFEIMRDEDGGVSLEKRSELEGSTVSGRMAGFMSGLPEGVEEALAMVAELATAAADAVEGVDAVATPEPSFDQAATVPLSPTVH